MKARQNPLTKFESFMQRIVEGPFAFLFPSKLQPAEIARKLERAMEDHLQVLGEGRRLAPNVYDIFVSIKDHQQLSSSESILNKDWQDHLINVAKQRHYTLRSIPVLRLHASSDLRPGAVRIEADMSGTGNLGAEAGIMATQALSADQLAQMRAAASFPGQPGLPDGSGSSPSHPGSPSMPPNQPMQAAPPMSQAWLTIRLPQANQQIYHIEKPVINIGRQLSNDIIVEDKRVSRYHAAIKYDQTKAQFTIFDLGSTNGITINGTPHMRQHALRSGDRFTIGSYDFYFEQR